MAESDKTEAVNKHLARTGKSANEPMTYADYVALERGDADALEKHDQDAIDQGERQPAIGAPRSGQRLLGSGEGSTPPARGTRKRATAKRAS